MLSQGFTPLHHAAGEGRKPAQVRSLLEKGASPDKLCSHPDGPSTALHQAAMYGEPKSVMLLLAYGADAKLRTTQPLGSSSSSMTPLEVAQRAQEAHDGSAAGGGGDWQSVIDILRLAEDADGLASIRARVGVRQVRPEAHSSQAGGGSRRVNHNCATLFHYTNRAAADAIVTSQHMMRGGQGVAGGGIYFARTPADARRKSQGGSDACLQADVWLGNPKLLDAMDHGMNFTTLSREGFDSVWLTCMNGDELVVYNYDQVENIKRVG